MTSMINVFGGDSLSARLVRSIGWTAVGFVAAQMLRLATNLIFARLLYPEAFGLMALVSVFLVGLAMFSDVGLGPSIMQNKRGDDPAFLNTAWTIQVARGSLLWLGSCILAQPAAYFYNEQLLAQLLPAAGLSLLLAGFNPTQIDTANRHLKLERVVILDLTSQIIGAVIMILLAWIMRSVWALVIGAVIGALAKLILAHILLPNARNRLAWDPQAARELIHFGKWLFLSTALGFIVAQGDKAILGKYLSLDTLGLYNIAYFLASAPMLLGGAIISRILIPLYREKPPHERLENFRKVRLLRFGLTTTILALMLVLAFCGSWIVHLLYDARYAMAGAMVTLVACMQIPQVIGLTYDQAALANGDSRNFFFLFVARATIQITCFIIGVEFAGLIGGLTGQGLAVMLIHPLIINLARRHKVWDWLHDAFFSAVGLALGGLALWINRDAISALIGIGVS
ncbi:oligosaccharide flippase family protein [Leptospira interrogans]